MKKNFPILLIDQQKELDVFLSRLSVQSFPEASFLQILTTTSAKAYLEGLIGQGPKLILMDVRLRTTGSGFDFLAYKKDHSQARYIPTVMLSDSQLESDVQTSYSEGANGYLVKPDSTQGWMRLLATLRQYWFNTVTLPAVHFT